MNRKIIALGIVGLGVVLMWLWASGTLHQRWLKYAAEQSNWDRVIRLVESGTNPNIYLDVKKTGHAFAFSPLTAAIKDQRYDVVTKLLRYKANPRMTGPFGIESLHMAIAYNDVPMVKLLLDNGADPEESNRMNLDGRPMWSTLEDKDLEVLKLFIQAGAQIKQQRDGKYLWDTEYMRTNNPKIYEYLRAEVQKSI